MLPSDVAYLVYLIVMVITMLYILILCIDAEVGYTCVRALDGHFECRMSLCIG